MSFTVAFICTILFCFGMAFREVRRSNKEERQNKKLQREYDLIDRIYLLEAKLHSLELSVGKVTDEQTFEVEMDKDGFYKNYLAGCEGK